MPRLREGARRLDRALRHAQARLARHSEAIERMAPVDVHQLRVASRRIRSLLKTFRRHVRRSAANRYREALGRAARQISRLRELDALAALPGMRGAVVARALRAAREEEVARLHRNRVAKRWREVVYDGPTVAQLGLDPGLASDEIERTLRRQWRRVEPLLQASPTEPDSLHSLRIRLKSLRYAFESVSDPGDASVAAMQDRLRATQALLGAERDVACAGEWLKRSGLSPSVIRRSLGLLRRRARGLSARRATELCDLARAGDRWYRSTS